MEKEKLESLLIDYLDGILSEADQALVERELKENENAAKLHAQLKEVLDLMANTKVAVPRTSFKLNFEKALQAEISKSGSTVDMQRTQPAGKQIFFSSWIVRVAAAFIVVVDTISPLASATLNVILPGLPMYNRALSIITGICVLTFT